MKNVVEIFRNRIFGYDIFISYSRNDGLNYSYAIAQHFLNKGYECYIDQLSSTSPGAKLPRNIQNSVKKSTSFVLIGSISAQISEPISKEIQLFLDSSKNKPIIPISIDGAINEDAIWYNNIQGLAIIEDTKYNLTSGSPSKEALDRIENALTFTKRSDRLRRTFLSTLITIAMIIAFSFYYVSKKTNEANQANDARIEAEKLSTAAIQEREQAIAQMKNANELKSKADSLRNIAENEKVIADSLTVIAESQKSKAEKRVQELNIQSENLQIRIAANEYLSIDPIKAYRLAQGAYNVIESEENRALIMSSVSQIDYYYTTSLDGYEIMDFKEPYILLVNQNSLDDHPNLLVYDMKSNQTKKTNIYADHAWIIPYNNSWRILTRNWNGNGIDAIAEYQLWNKNNKPLSEKIPEGGLSIAQFINNHTVSIKLRSKAQLLSWDLHTNKMYYFEQKERDDFSETYFYEIYGALDTRSDGVAAGHYNDGLVLIKSNGEIDEPSYTQVDFDPSSFFTRAHWSPDDKFLALNYFDRKRLGVWNPHSNSFVWLDPDGWVVNSYSWSQSGHLLAFSGRTENDVDVTVEILDADNPVRSREIVYKGKVPIQSMTFSYDDKNLVICDKESNMFIIDIENKEIVGKGQQADKVYGSSKELYSSGQENFKIWSNIPSPLKHWEFNSDSGKTYYPAFSTDPSNKWLAVPYFQKSDTTVNYEIRNVKSGYKRTFKFKESHHNLTVKFSNDGNWILIKSSEDFLVCNTKSWNSLKTPKFLENRIINEFYEIENGLEFISKRDSTEYFDKFTWRIEKNEFSSCNKTILTEFRSINPIRDMSQEEIKNLVDGWELDKLYKYRAAGWRISNNWAVLITCRDGSLGARDCDVQFVPTDVDWLMALFNDLVWSPTDQKIDELLKTKQ